MTENNQDRSQSEGQEGIDRETELRNRENETGQQDQPAANATLSERTGQTSGQDNSRFVGSSSDQSSDYLTKSEENQDLAPEGQGAQDTSASRSDIETGQSRDESSRDEDPAPTGE
jgi:hypothetical protein